LTIKSSDAEIGELIRASQELSPSSNSNEVNELKGQLEEEADATNKLLTERVAALEKQLLDDKALTSQTSLKKLPKRVLMIFAFARSRYTFS
jgi:hypothetical protein